MKLRSGLALLVFTLASLAIGSSALAQHRSGGSHWGGGAQRGGASQWHGSNAWRGGHWSYGHRDGRLGWWWVAGGLWPFYAAPVYPYPYAYPYAYPYSYPWLPPVALAAPPANFVPPVPPTENWYYCEAARAYYPYVATCPGGWREVPAKPSDSSPIPQQ